MKIRNNSQDTRITFFLGEKKYALGPNEKTEDLPESLLDEADLAVETHPELQILGSSSVQKASQKSLASAMEDINPEILATKGELNKLCDAITALREDSKRKHDSTMREIRGLEKRISELSAIAVKGKEIGNFRIKLRELKESMVSATQFSQLQNKVKSMDSDSSDHHQQHSNHREGIKKMSKLLNSLCATIHRFEENDFRGELDSLAVGVEKLKRSAESEAIKLDGEAGFSGYQASLEKHQLN